MDQKAAAIDAASDVDAADEDLKERKSRKPRQAILIVHGMGEQRPMDTVRDFVRTVWEQATGLTKSEADNAKQIWTRPDGRTGSLELRRVTTRVTTDSDAFPKGVRNDFYELYWADLTGGSTWDQFTNWVWYLLFRPLRLVPRDVRLAWGVLWIGAIVAALLALAMAVPKEMWDKHVPLMPRWLFLAAAGALGTAMHKAATASFGRVVRYTRSEPSNIAARAAVRKRGLKLLEELHAGQDYDRVIIVGHSLGTILAYDLVSYFWARREEARFLEEGSLELAAANAVKTAGDAIDTPGGIERYRTAQAAFRRLLASRPRPEPTDSRTPRHWLISDLVTIGSPLTHAEFLLASSPADFERRVAEREYPVAPPVLEPLDGLALWRAGKAGLIPEGTKEANHFLFPASSRLSTWQLHHAAPFAAVRWTNIHDPARCVVWGDLISGPLRQHFGHGVRDVDLKALRGQSHHFSHTLYWAENADPKQLEALRDALNLLDEDP